MQNGKKLAYFMVLACHINPAGTKHAAQDMSSLDEVEVCAGNYTSVQMQ